MRRVEKLDLMAGAAAFALLVGLGAPAAAEAETGTVREVVVTGLGSVSGSPRQIKADAPQIVDSLTVEQIDRLPDLSLAEALERIPGVNGVIGYQVSESRTVTVRGFDARYNSFNIDGNPIWNSSRNNRGTQLDVFPSSVVNQINVYKTVSPEQDANSIGGHVELRTLRAFDGGGRPYFTGRVSTGGYDQESLTGEGEIDYRVSGVFKTAFGPDRRFGTVLGLETQKYDFFDKYNQVTGYAQQGDIDVVSGSLFRGLFQHEMRRDAVYAKLEAGSDDQLYGFISANYFRQQEEDNSHRGGVFLAPSQIKEAGAGVGNFTNAVSEAYLEQYHLDRETLLLASGFDYRLSPRGALNVRASYTRYDNDEITYRSERFQLTGLSGRYDISDTEPNTTFTPSTALGDASRYVYRTGRDAFENKIPHQDDVYSLRADYAFNTFSGAEGLGFKAGIYARRLDRVFDQTRLNYRLPAGAVLRLSEVVDPRSPSPTGSDPVYIDGDILWAYLQANGAFSQNDYATADYHLVEDVIAGHASASYVDGPWRLLAGVRVEHTRYTNDNSETRAGALTPVTRSFDYTEVLPNLQVSYDFTPALRLRGAYTETLARPDFADFAFGRTVTIDQNGATVISGTNPYLEPRTSRNYDLSLEWYLTAGYVSLGAFRKDLDHETFTQRTETRDASGVITLIETIPLNTGSSSVQGLEASLVLDKLTMLPGALADFGFSTNYSWLDGEWNVVFSDGSRRTVEGLRNQPRWIANATLSYEKGPFDANLAYRAQGRTFTGGFGATEAGDVWRDNSERLDIQLGYRVSPQVRLVGEVRNLTDSWYVEQTGLGGDDLALAIAPGRSWSVGARFKF